jgi:hypothetical protein
MRLSAFRFLFFVVVVVARMKRSVIRDRHSSSQTDPGFRCAPSGLRAVCKTRARIASREEFVLPVLRHPEVRAQRASKGDGPGRASFEGRFAATSG